MEGLQDVFFYFIARKEQGKLTEEMLQEKYMRPRFGVGDKDLIIELLAKAGITVRYYDPEEKRWMDQSESGGLEVAPGDRDGGWTQPNLEIFKREYLQARFGASVAA